jgi:hypothetical protein
MSHAVDATITAARASLTMLRLLLLLLATLAVSLCCAQQDNGVFTLDSNGRLLISDGNNLNVTLRALVAELATLAADQSELVAEACFPSRLRTIQSIPTVGAIDVEHFSIGNRDFLAVASWFNGTSHFTTSQILLFDSITSTFVPYQSIPTFGARDLEFFTIGGQSYLALANQATNDSNWSLNSQVFRWNGSSFSLFQAIPTLGATDLEFFTIANTSYLAIANQRDDSTVNRFSVNSQVLRFNGTSFVPFQTIPTIGAVDCEFISIGSGQFFLAIANFRNETSFSTNSQILRFNGSVFVPFQTVPTDGAIALESFSISGQSFLALVSRETASNVFALNSQILRWNGTSFAPFQFIRTQGATDVQFFSLNGQSFLALASYQDSPTSFSINSEILRFDGSRFVPFASVPTQGGSEWEFFSMGGQSYLAVANRFNGSTHFVSSQVFRLVAPCFL